MLENIQEPFKEFLSVKTFLFNLKKKKSNPCEKSL